MALVFDIETVGEPWESLDHATQENILRWTRESAKSEEEFEHEAKEIKEGLGFSPLTGAIVAIGVLDTETHKGAVYFSTKGKKLKDSEENGIKYRPMEEKEMLEQFWLVAKSVNEFVSFNGRCFDAPFIFIRSMVHGVAPTRDLMEGRYLYQQRSCKHYDLLDQLTFYGAARYKKSLHLFCRALGIESPKAGGTTGDDVAGLYAAGKYLELARYNAGDLFATALLYRRWRDTVR